MNATTLQDLTRSWTEETKQLADDLWWDVTGGFRRKELRYFKKRVSKETPPHSQAIWPGWPWRGFFGIVGTSLSACSAPQKTWAKQSLLVRQRQEVQTLPAGI